MIAIRDYRDEARLAEFVKVYTQRKASVLKETTDVFRADEKRIVDDMVEAQLVLWREGMQHREAWEPFLERDRVYNDTAAILDRLEREDESGREVVFRFRRELNTIHLNREPVLTVLELKQKLRGLGRFDGVAGEAEGFDYEITPALVQVVMAFQRDSGLEQVDGIVGPYTKGKLDSETAAAIGEGSG